ncbi:hypothetical protein ACP70R_025780 [Stipagrostis hirtigluma subsp. patula]
MTGPRGKRKAAASPVGKRKAAASPVGKRKAAAYRAGKRKAQAKPEAAPPARQSRRFAAAPPYWPVDTALWIRPSSPVITEATAHLNLTHMLRSGRKVYVPDTSKPGPVRYKKGEEPVYDVSWQTPACAKVGLEHYNRLNEDKHELVKAVDSVAFFFNGPWFHVNFLAKSKGATNCVDLVPKYFFAELKTGPDGNMSCVSCIKMDPGLIPKQNLSVVVKFAQVESFTLLPEDTEVTQLQWRLSCVSFGCMIITITTTLYSK